MKATPVRGTMDFLPAQAALRSAVQDKILEIYSAFGFHRIETPVMEDIENLDKSEGGDNLNLIFKILKRGDKLERALEENGELADIGLRYDLTLPLSRYYAANKEKLPSPFKSIQIGPAFRAERPQKGRMRQFIQCDIDILGDESENAETELIYVTAKALLALGFTGFTVLINDRRVLKALLKSFGFAQEDLDSVCVTFDKLDKIGADGVAQEMLSKGFPSEAVDSFKAFLSGGNMSLDSILSQCGDPEAGKRLEKVLEASAKLSEGNYQVQFTPSLVRGQGYYTGMVFEIQCPGYAGSVAGGGRYDGMVEKFTGKQVTAVGFSIGFERITQILMEQGQDWLAGKPAMALLYSIEADFSEVMKKAGEYQGQYRVTALPKGKNPGKQLKRLAAEGYRFVVDFDTGSEKQLV